MSPAARPFAVFGFEVRVLTRAMLEHLSTWSLLALLLIGSVLVGCVDDAPTAPTNRPVHLALNARILGLDAAVAYRLEVHVAYRRTSGELVELLDPPARLSVPPGTSTHTVSVNIEPCLDDPQRQEPNTESCRLVVRLHLLDEGSAIVATANQDAPTPVSRGGTVALSAVELSPLPPATPMIIEPVVVDFVTTVNATTAPGSQTVTISTSDGGTLTGLSAGSITYRPSGVEWLKAPTIDQASATSTAPAILTLEPSTTALAPGEYSATVSIAAASGANNSPQAVTVNYRVHAADAPPTMVLTPSSVNFGPVSRSVEAPGSQQVTIRSSTGVSLSPLTIADVRYDPSSAPDWLVANLSSDGSVLTLAARTTDLEPFTYRATVTVSSGVTGVVPQSVRVTYVVQPEAPALPSRVTIALQPDTLLIGQSTVATATVTDANGTVLPALPAGALISWTSSDPTVLPHPAPTTPFTASAAALREGTITVSATLTLPDRTTIVSNAVPLTVNARQFTLSVQLGGSGAGTVTSLESRIPLINCTWDGSRTSGTCSAAYPEGQPVSLRSAPAANSSFDGWGEACAGTEGAECRVVMDQDKTAAATFTQTLAGTIEGTTRNAVDASSVPSAVVELRAGEADTSSTPVARTQSGADGSYGFNGLPSGVYTAVARANGYITGIASEIVVTGEEVSNRDIILSPILLEGETRIILTWGDSPQDLDAHLTGGTDESPFHVYYDEKGSLTDFPFAFLDIDDRTGQGPETITIARQSGLSRFFVHDFSSLESGNTAALGASGAKVQVFQGERLVALFNVPEQGGTLWTVFELNGPVITPVNTMTFGTPFQTEADRNATMTGAAVRRAGISKDR